jgi:hypothetical protein
MGDVCFSSYPDKLLGKKSIHMADILIFDQGARNQYSLLNTNFQSRFRNGEHLKPKKSRFSECYLCLWISCRIFFCRYTFYRSRWLHNLPVEYCFPLSRLDHTSFHQGNVDPASSELHTYTYWWSRLPIHWIKGWKISWKVFPQFQWANQ